MNMETQREKSVEVPKIVVNPPELEYKDIPVSTQCPNCRNDIVTVLKYKPGLFTYGLCVGLGFIGFFLGCCFIPFCVNSTKDVVHECPNCEHILADYKRL